MNTIQSEQKVQSSDNKFAIEWIIFVGLLLIAVFEILLALNSIYYSQTAPSDHGLTGPLVKLFTSFLFLIVSFIIGMVISRKLIGDPGIDDGWIAISFQILVYVTMGPGLLALLLVLF